MPRYRFAGFLVDTDRRELLRGDDVLRLPPKAFELLQVLVTEHPKAVSQSSIHDKLWPDTFVDRGSIHNLVHQIRRVLGDHDQQIVRNVYGYGFALGADVIEAEPTPQPKLLVTVGNDEFDLQEGENVVGREFDAQVRIDSPAVSRRHARIVVHGDEITIEDLGSKNGTFVDGSRIRRVTPLKSGDQILFGTIAARFHILAPPPETETAES